MTVTSESRRGRVPVPAFALPRRRRGTLEAQRARAGRAFAAPAAVIVGLFFLVPLGLSLWISLHRWPLIAGEHTFNAPDNYKAVKDQLFKDAVVFTLKYTLITTVFLSLVAFALALLAQESRRLRGLFRTTYFLPAAVGLAASSLIFYALYNETQGPLNDMLEWTGLVGPINWLGTPNNALLSTVGMVTWRFAGFYMLIILTGLQAIPTDVYEAARVDGAGWWRTLRSITLPLRPTLALMLILSVTGSILAFDQFYILTNGGPDNSTITVVLAIYRQAFFLFDLGKGAALSIIVLVILLALNIVQFRILRTSDQE
jgi:multiple sugar transport system permease protein